MFNVNVDHVLTIYFDIMQGTRRNTTGNYIFCQPKNHLFYVYLYDIDFFVVSVFIFKKNKREEMCNQYEAHEVYFYYACVKYDVIGYMTSSCRDEWNRFLLL